MRFWLRTPRWSTLTVRSWSTTRPSTTSAPKNLVSKGRPTPTWTDLSVKLCHLWQVNDPHELFLFKKGSFIYNLELIINFKHRFASTVPWTWTWTSSRLIWSRIRESTFPSLLMRLSSRLNGRSTSNSQFLNWETAVLRTATNWSKWVLKFFGVNSDTFYCEIF